ncbi:DNA-binding protein [Labedella endophytica]|jgi:hypothetical protein|uniref:DNA-binding protein n=1 Tax=Labedella endophytica TaxID=1523160 RepID=A0A433JRZ3_9MICO|nr:DNA-binding protein [Labedella endophytica]RUR01041.1 DNA-binding protein [Labedella endophytica]
MFVITADQVDSRSHDDAVSTALARIEAIAPEGLLLPAERTAGDEIQALTDDADTAYRLVLELSRDGRWSIGVGIGPVRLPLGDSTRASTGEAFFAARAAIDAAKRTPSRFALRVEPEPAPDPLAVRAEDVEALMTVVLALREKRTDKGWEVHDLLAAGATQSRAASALGITQGAVSMRARTGSSREELAASEAIVRLLAMLDHTTMLAHTTTEA